MPETPAAVTDNWPEVCCPVGKANHPAHEAAPTVQLVIVQVAGVLVAVIGVNPDGIPTARTGALITKLLVETTEALADDTPIDTGPEPVLDKRLVAVKVRLYVPVLSPEALLEPVDDTVIAPPVVTLKNPLHGTLGPVQDVKAAAVMPPFEIVAVPAEAPVEVGR